MNWVADESVDRQIVEELRRRGQVVWSVAEMAPTTADDQVLSFSNRESALLLTADKDFGELVFRQHHAAQGIVLIRLAGLNPARKAEIVATALAEHEKELRGNFTVISTANVRVRRFTE